MQSQAHGWRERLTGMHDESPKDLARVLGFAATYLEERGRARFSFGGGPGKPMCPVAAIALALGYRPWRVGWRNLFMVRSAAQNAVGLVILRSGLLDRLPVPSTDGRRRKLRPARMSPFRAVRELARWNDDKAIDTIVISALRDQARALRASELLSASTSRAFSSGLRTVTRI